jgi:hypothetical protein
VLSVIGLLAIDQRNGIVISCLFNNALSVNTECVVSNENMTGKLRIGKDMEGSGRALI